MRSNMKKPIVAVLKTKPETVIEDYHRLLDFAEIDNYLDKKKPTGLKINISWHKYYPACSTTPWQLEGTIRSLLKRGVKQESLTALHNKTVVVDDRVGGVANKQDQVTREMFGLAHAHLNDPGEEWVHYQPRGKMMVLPEIYPEGIMIPKRFADTNIIQFPTMKTHVFTTTTGAMKNAFGGLLNTRRHWTHGVIHETLVDLLTIQKEIHSGLFAVMDGTFSGDGPGPRCMRLHETDYILASADQVAIDAVAAKMMGFEPLQLKYLRLADERGLGVARLEAVEVRGEEIQGVNFGFKSGSTFASRGQRLIYHGWLKPLERLLLRTFLAPWSYIASRIYHDVFWYPLIGRRRVKRALATKWGRLFQKY